MFLNLGVRHSGPVIQARDVQAHLFFTCLSGPILTSFRPKFFFYKIKKKNWGIRVRLPLVSIVAPTPGHYHYTYTLHTLLQTTLTDPQT